MPFPYLLPNPALLPPESIRFFYLDVDWLAEVAAGMLGVFGAGARAQAFASSQSPTLRALLYQALAQGEAGPAPTATTSTVVSGFLLRSIVVSNWPQAQFQAFATVPEAVPVSPYRLEKLTSTLLMGLYPARWRRCGSKNPITPSASAWSSPTGSRRCKAPVQLSRLSRLAAGGRLTSRLWLPLPRRHRPGRRRNWPAS